MADIDYCKMDTSKNYALNVVVPDYASSLPVGASLTGVITYDEIQVAECTPTLNPSYVDMLLAGTRSIAGVGTDGKIIYNTNVSGVGIKVGGKGHVLGDDVTFPEHWLSTSTNPAKWTGSTKNNGSNKVYFMFYPEIELIKTSSSIGGGQLSGIVGKVSSDTPGAEDIVMYLVLNGEIHASGCTVNSGQDLNITLDDVQKKDLSSVGSTWGQSNPENIELTCNQGTNVNVTFAGSQAADSTDASIFANNGSAKGLGVQLLNAQGEPYVIGEKVAAVTNSGTTATIPVSARYIRTGDLGAGSVEASATYTLDYE